MGRMAKHNNTRTRLPKTNALASSKRALTRCDKNLHTPCYSLPLSLSASATASSTAFLWRCTVSRYAMKAPDLQSPARNMNANSRPRSAKSYACPRLKSWRRYNSEFAMPNVPKRRRKSANARAPSTVNRRCPVHNPDRYFPAECTAHMLRDFRQIHSRTIDVALARFLRRAR